MTQTPTKRMPSAVRANFIALFALFDMMDQLGEKEFKPLIEGRTKDGWKRFKLARKLMENICYSIMDTIPTDQLKQIRWQCEHSNVRISMKGAVMPPHDSMWVLDVQDCVTLAQKAIESGCLMCDKTLGEPCELRKILDDLPIDIDEDLLLMSCRKGI